MKRILSTIILLFAFSLTYAQDNVKLEKKGDITEATYFYEDGTVQQHGYFNEDGKVQGIWTSYDVNGKKLATGKYDNGKKIGKWFFWTEDSLNEVDFIDSKIINVSEWKNETKVVIRD